MDQMDASAGIDSLIKRTADMAPMPSNSSMFYSFMTLIKLY